MLKKELLEIKKNLYIFASLLLNFLHYYCTQWSCSASGSLSERPDSNPGPLLQKSGALWMSHHISICRKRYLRGSPSDRPSPWATSSWRTAPRSCARWSATPPRARQSTATAGTGFPKIWFGKNKKILIQFFLKKISIKRKENNRIC